MRRWIGLALALGGVLMLGKLFYPAVFHTLRTAPAYSVAMPSALLLGMLALIALAAGLHLLLSRPDGEVR
jgi:hypothetical protein